MAVLDQLEVLQSKTHDLGTWLSIIAVPSAQPGDDPSGVGQRAFWVRVLLALRLAFKLSRKGFQEPLVGRIEGCLQHLICAAIASAHQLQDEYAGDSPCADEARHGVGVFNLRRLDVKTRRLQRAEIVLDDPASAVEVEHHACGARIIDCMRGHQPPMDRLALFRGRRFPDVQKGQRNGHRQIRCRAILRLTHLDTSMAKGEFRTARLAAWRCRDRNDEASLFRQVVGKGKQRGVLVCRRLDPAVLRDPREQMNASWSPGKLLVDVAFPIGNDRDPRSLAQHLRGAKHSIQPALRFLVGRWPLAAWSDLATRAIAHRHVDRAKQRPRRRINRQNSMQQQSTYSPAAPHRSKSASPCRLAPERQFTAVLDRQDIASRNQAGGPRRRGRRHLGDGHGRVVQKTLELDLPGPMAPRQPTDARSWPRDQRSLQLSPPFCRRRSPNCPSPTASQTHVIEGLPRINRLHGISPLPWKQSRCVHTTAPASGGGSTLSLSLALLSMIAEIRCGKPHPSSSAATFSLSSALTASAARTIALACRKSSARKAPTFGRTMRSGPPCLTFSAVMALAMP